MLENSFRIIRGIGEKTEKSLWDLGIRSWDDIEMKNCPNGISNNLWRIIRENIYEYKKLLRRNDYRTLNETIPKDLTWRAIPNYQGRIAYLDIETTGLSYNNSQITTIAVFDGKTVNTFVDGINLRKFRRFIGQFPTIATFYGKCFDIPFIRNYLGIEMPQIHFDVCFLLKKIGFSGGLKAIEKQFRFSRGILSKLDGYHAVLLWNQYRKTRDERYLETLLAYNAEDVLNLEYLLNFAYNEISMKENLPFNPLPTSERTVNNPFKAHKNIVREILSMNKAYGCYY
ncbi:MAG: ribonuclease H-like domain-containing protein [Candidatus Lokiarchaeota archaeon]|nr:ribonuclease H-like domain-containing protein [Candidatus Lokiarchaeota archaeon]